MIFYVLGSWRASYNLTRGFLCGAFKNIFLHSSIAQLAISRFQVRLFPIRGLQHNKITGRNKLKDFSLTKQTTLGPVSLCTPSPGITWKVLKDGPSVVSATFCAIVHCHRKYAILQGVGGRSLKDVCPLKFSKNNRKNNRNNSLLFKKQWPIFFCPFNFF